MALNDLFDIATRYGGRLALAIADELPGGRMFGSAFVFDLEKLTQLRRFRVRYERSGTRAAISRDDRFCIIGCYDTYGLGAYCTESGEEIWRRRDLKAVQSVVASEVEDWVFCVRQGAAAHLVDTISGKTIDTFSGLKDTFTSPFDRSVFLASKTLELHSPLGHKITTLKRTNTLGLECVFSPSEFLIAEPDCVRCYDIKTLELLWTLAAQAADRYTRAIYIETEGIFSVQNGSWISLDARTGTIRRTANLVTELGYVSGFCLRGKAVLATNLQMLSLETGSVLADLATPELIARDPKARIDRLKELAAGSRSLHELEQYMTAEGFDNNDITRVLLMKQMNDRNGS